MNKSSICLLFFTTVVEVVEPCKTGRRHRQIASGEDEQIARASCTDSSTTVGSGGHMNIEKYDKCACGVGF